MQWRSHSSWHYYGMWSGFSMTGIGVQRWAGGPLGPVLTEEMCFNGVNPSLSPWGEASQNHESDLFLR